MYVPAGCAPGERSDVGKRAFLEAVARHACDEYSHPLLIAGDFNVAPTDEDVYEPAWFADSFQTGAAEREDLRAILCEGELVDVYRTLHPEEHGYTCWEQREGHYGRDYGLRIDLILASESLAPYIGACEVNHTYRRGFRPSNHAPLDVELEDVRACAHCLDAREELDVGARGSSSLLEGGTLGPRSRSRHHQRPRPQAGFGWVPAPPRPQPGVVGTSAYNATAARGGRGTSRYLRLGLTPAIRQLPSSLTRWRVVSRSLPDHVLFTSAVAVAPLTVTCSTVAS